MSGIGEKKCTDSDCNARALSIFLQLRLYRIIFLASPLLSPHVTSDVGFILRSTFPLMSFPMTSSGTISITGFFP